MITRMLVDKINKGAKEDREGFTTTGGGIHQTAFTVDDMLPGLLLKNKRMITPAGKPFTDNFIPGCCFQSRKHTANLTSSFYISGRRHINQTHEHRKSTIALELPENNTTLAFPDYSFLLFFWFNPFSLQRQITIDPVIWQSVVNQFSNPANSSLKKILF
jgi:hypothetical protein